MPILHHKLPRKGQAGMTLIEIAIALPIVVLALGMFVQMLTAGTGMRQVSHDQWIASNSIQSAIEVMHNDDFAQLFALYNEDPLDDPGGPGTAPGPNFSVEGLQPLDSDADGMVGRIHVPAFNAGSVIAPDWQLREDQPDASLGLPRDLNGDCIIDARDHSVGYTLMPVEVEIQWRSRFGPRMIRMQTLIAELR